MTADISSVLGRVMNAVLEAMKRLKDGVDSRIVATETCITELRAEVLAASVTREAELTTELRAHCKALLDAQIASILDAQEMAKRVAALVPVPVLADFVDEKRVLDLIAAATERLQPAIDLTEFTRGLVAQLPSAAAIAEDAAKLIPVPKDGQSFTLEEARHLVAETVGAHSFPTTEEVAALLANVHMAGWALDFERRAQDLLQRAIDRIPRPKDGEDGMGFDDLVVEYDGERTFTVALVQGERRKAQSFKMPIMIYRKVYVEGSAYERGDVVTWGGSSWVALKDAPQGKPGDTSRDWQLIVKKGRDGN